MKTFIGSLLCTIGLCIILFLPARAQERPAQPEMLLRRLSIPFFPPQPRAETPPRFRIPGKKVSQYTAEEWGRWIDSTWGPGQTAVQQLHVFDTFWDRVNTSWGGFPNLSLNWDSIRTLYRPQIGSGLSRGRFAALMSRVWMPLIEHHTYIYDMTVDKAFGSDNTGFWNYKAGIPLLVIGTQWWDLLGAPVTALQDSTGLVYRAATGNPLGLQPGDVVLGYEGVPWKKLYPRLLEIGVPINRYWTSSPGSTPESRIQLAMSAVGWNWGMFDTIDVVKYATGDTVHLPTAPLATLTQNIWASDQVSVSGVPMPEGGANNTNAVSWGVVQGTNIGYIYVWDWSTSSTPQRFADAVSDLRYTKKVEGLIIDFRMNWGGEVGYANHGFAQLFGFDPTPNWSFATRANAGDHMSFSPIQLNFGFTPIGPSFDRPIAMLIGPGCLSAGDYNAFRLRFHPMARSFGKPTNGAFVAALQEAQSGGTVEQAWKYESWPGLMVSLVPGEGYMIHKGVQPDESVWLTRDGVAKGEDGVVKRAIEWMSTLTYAHDVAVNRPFARSGLDSICVTASLTNPLAHTAALTAIVTDTSGRVRDSLQMYDDGAHGDVTAGDNIWGCRLRAPLEEHYYRVEVRTVDKSMGTFRRLPDAGRFSTAGPLVVDSVWVAVDFGLECWLKLRVRNMGTTFTVRGAKVTPRCADPWVMSIDSNPLPLPDLAPGARSTTDMFSIRPDPTTSPGHFNLRFEATIDGWVYWTDSTKIVTDVEAGRPLPQTFALEQNYPNPFNPSTTIKFELPKASQVSLSVFDILGRQVSVLVNDRRDAGIHEVKFDASSFPSGAYFYRLQAGSYVETRRLLLVR